MAVSYYAVLRCVHDIVDEKTFEQIVAACETITETDADFRRLLRRIRDNKTDLNYESVSPRKRACEQTVLNAVSQAIGEKLEYDPSDPDGLHYSCNHLNTTFLREIAQTAIAAYRNASGEQT